MSIGLAIFWIVLILVLTFASNSAGLFFWLKRRQFARFMESEGLVKKGENGYRLELHGLEMTVKLHRVKSGDAELDRFEARLQLPESEVAYKLYREGLNWGLMRSVGVGELTLGDDNFDQAFWIECEEKDGLLHFLTPERRAALIHVFQDDSGELTGHRIRISRSFWHPFYGRRYFRRVLLRLREAAEIFGNDGEPSPACQRAARSVAQVKTRKFVPWSIAFSVGIPFLLSLLASSTGSGERIFHLVAVIGLVISISALAGVNATRLILQSYFAFLALASAAVPFVALFSGSIYGDYQSYLAVFVSGLLLALLSWGVRHFLKSQEKPIRREPSRAEPGF